MKMEEQKMKAPMPKVEIDSLSTTAYLDHTVVPIIMDAMTEVARKRYFNVYSIYCACRWFVLLCCRLSGVRT